jgi:phosphoglycolate phosphatase-like HAD superfamily hydrolase
VKLFVWDFHSVLEKGNDLSVLEISNTVLKKLGYKEHFTLEDIKKLNGLKWYEYFENLLPNEPHYMHMKIQASCFALSNDNPEIIAHCIKPNDYVFIVLDKIQQKHQQILISNTTPKSLKFFIKSVGIDSYFTNNNSFAVDGHTPDKIRSKKIILDKYLRNKSFESIVVIGDSPADIELANYNNATSYLYTYPGMEFKKCIPTYKITDLRKILKEI